MSSSGDDNKENVLRSGKVDFNNKKEQHSRNSRALVRFRSLPNLNFSRQRRSDILTTPVSASANVAISPPPGTASTSELGQISVLPPRVRRQVDNTGHQPALRTRAENFYYSAGIQASGRVNMDAPNGYGNFGAQGFATGPAHAMQSQHQQPGRPGGTPSTFNYGANIFNFNFMNPGQYELNFTAGNGFHGINAQPPVVQPPSVHPHPYHAALTPSAEFGGVPRTTGTNGISSVAGLATSSPVFPNCNSGTNSFNYSRHGDSMNVPTPLQTSNTAGQTPWPRDLCRAPPHLANQYHDSNLAFHRHQQRRFRQQSNFHPNSMDPSLYDDDVFDEDQDLRGGGSQNSMKSSNFGFHSQ